MSAQSPAIPDPRQLHEELTNNVRGSVSAPDSMHEQLVKSIRSMVQEMIDASVPKMATVTGQDGGKVLVQMDNEDTPRQLGFSRKNGQRYNPGDRVVTMPTGSGDDHVILGTITNAQGEGEQAVGNPDLIDQSVDENKIKPGAVKKTHIAPNAVGNSEVGSQEIQGSSGGGTTNIKQGSIAKKDFDNPTANQLDGAVQGSDLPGDAKNSPKQLATKSDIPDTSGFAKSSDLKDYAKASDVNSNIVSKLDGKTIKPNRDGSITLPSLSNV
jgi:hypothetical protein